MGDETLIGLLHIMPKTHPLLIKRIGTAVLDNVPGASTIFPVVKLVILSGFGHALSAPVSCSLDDALRSLN